MSLRYGFRSRIDSGTPRPCSHAIPSRSRAATGSRKCKSVDQSSGLAMLHVDVVRFCGKHPHSPVPQWTNRQAMLARRSKSYWQQKSSEVRILVRGTNTGEHVGEAKSTCALCSLSFFLPCVSKSRGGKDCHVLLACLFACLVHHVANKHRVVAFASYRCAVHSIYRFRRRVGNCCLLEGGVALNGRGQE